MAHELYLIRSDETYLRKHELTSGTHNQQSFLSVQAGLQIYSLAFFFI